MKHEIHRTDTEHRGVGIESVEESALVVLGITLLQQLGLVVFLHILGTLYNESCTSHSRIAYAILQIRLHEFHHHLNDMSRRAELSVVARCCHLAKYILVHVAHRITIIHIERINTIDNLHQGSRILHEESCICHEATIGTLLTIVKVLDEGEGIATDDAIHLLSILILEYAPSQSLVGYILVCLRIVPHTLLEGGFFHLYTHKTCIRLLRLLRIIEHFHKEQISHLLQDGDRVCYATCPKGVPYRIYAVLYLACNHSLVLIIVKC